MFKQLMAVLASSLLLSACGGGGGGTGGGDTIEISDDQAPDASAMSSIDDDAEVSGRVLDAVSGIALQGVRVLLQRSMAAGDATTGMELAAATTSSDGRFTFNDIAAAEDYRIVFEVDGYKNEVHANAAAHTAGDSTLEPVRLVSDDNAGQGRLAGFVGDVTDRAGRADVTLAFREGIDRRSGEVVATARTDANGNYEVSGIDYGNVTAQVSGEGIRTRYVTFQVLGNVLTTDQDVSIPSGESSGNSIGVGALRIVLTWDRRPSDLDAHLTGPSSDEQSYFHVLSGDRSADTARLVDDATMGFGPETIEVDPPRAGVYRYSVFNFSGDVDLPLEQSAAHVEVFEGDASLAVFTVPAGMGNVWTVFDIVDGQIVAVNTITRLRNVFDFFPPQGRDLAFTAAMTSGAPMYESN